MNRSALEPSRDPADYASCTGCAPFAETDAMGVIHHAAYLPYLEEARVEYLRSIEHPYGAVRSGRGDDSRDFPVLEVSVRYRKPVGFDEEVDVALRDRGRDGHDLPDRVSPVGRRRSARDRGHRARVRRPPGSTGAAAGVGGGEVRPRR